MNAIETFNLDSQVILKSFRIWDMLIGIVNEHN